MSKYTSVDIIFNIPVDAENTVEARKQAHEKLKEGAVGCSCCNTKDNTTAAEMSIPEEILNNLRTKSPVIQELADVTGMSIYNNNSLEEAIARILPSTKKIDKERLKELYDQSDNLEYKLGMEAVMYEMDICL